MIVAEDGLMEEHYNNAAEQQKRQKLEYCIMFIPTNGKGSSSAKFVPRRHPVAVEYYPTFGDLLTGHPKDEWINLLRNGFEMWISTLDGKKTTADPTAFKGILYNDFYCCCNNNEATRSILQTTYYGKWLIIQLLCFLDMQSTMLI